MIIMVISVLADGWFRGSSEGGGVCLCVGGGGLVRNPLGIKEAKLVQLK